MNGANHAVTGGCLAGVEIQNGPAGHMFALLLLLALPALAQPITIQAGSPTDQYFVGGVGAWAVPLAAPLAFLRYGTSFSYAIPVPNGFHNVAVVMVEPNKTAAYQRRFTVGVNGQVSAAIDLFQLTGGINRPYTLPELTYVSAGVLSVAFTATIGNAVVSEIVVTSAASVTGGPCSPPDAGVTIYAQFPDKTCLPLVPIPAAGNTAQIIQATSGETGVAGQTSQIIQVFFVAFTPAGSTAAPLIVRPDVLMDWKTCCAGIDRLKILRPDGSYTYLYGVPAPAVLPSSPWVDVP